MSDTERAIIMFAIGAVVFFAIKVFLTGCGPVRNEIHDNPGPVSACVAACDNLEAMDCIEGDGSPGADGEFGTADDVSCVEVCERVVESGIGLSQECVAEADSCSAARSCQ